MSEDCRFKDDEIVCNKCARNHETKGCATYVAKYINCVRQNKNEYMLNNYHKGAKYMT